MTRVAPLPLTGAVFLDERGSERLLRLSWHKEIDAFVISLWRNGECVGTFRLPSSETPRLVYALTAPLSDAARTAGRPAAG